MTSRRFWMRGRPRASVDPKHGRKVHYRTVSGHRAGFIRCGMGNPRYETDDIDSVTCELCRGYFYHTYPKRAPAQLKEDYMAMSNDRVHFKLPYTQNPSAEGRVQQRGMLNAAHRAFGGHLDDLERAMITGTTLVCRPSQFARFLIWRAEAGAQNSFTCLNAKLVMPVIECTLDVSKTRPSRATENRGPLWNSTTKCRA